MSHIADSDILIDFLFNRPDAVALLADLRRTGLAISVTSYMEVVEGVAGSATPFRAQRGLRIVLRHARILIVSRAVAERAAEIRRDLRHQKRQVNERALDILVAATAIEHRLTLVTRNTRDYDDIPGLRLHEPT